MCHGRGEFIPHKYGTPCFGGLVDASCLADALDPFQVRQRRAREEVIECQQRVSFAAAEIGLELHDGIAVLSTQATQRVREQLAQAMSEESACKKGTGIAVVVLAPSTVDLGQVGGKHGHAIA